MKLKLSLSPTFQLFQAAMPLFLYHLKDRQFPPTEDLKLRFLWTPSKLMRTLHWKKKEPEKESRHCLLVEGKICSPDLVRVVWAATLTMTVSLVLTVSLVVNDSNSARSPSSHGSSRLHHTSFRRQAPSDVPDQTSTNHLTSRSRSRASSRFEHTTSPSRTRTRTRFRDPIRSHHTTEATTTTESSRFSRFRPRDRDCHSYFSDSHNVPRTCCFTASVNWKLQHLNVNFWLIFKGCSFWC